MLKSQKKKLAKSALTSKIKKANLLRTLKATQNKTAKKFEYTRN